MLMHAITSARSAFLISNPLDVYVQIIQQIKRQRRPSELHVVSHKVEVEIDSNQF